jgi:dethiobiotin synthetase
LDAIRLRAAAGRDDLALSLICPISLPDPVAPAAAASATINLSSLLTSARGAAQHGTHLIVESAGGLLSPYSASLTNADLATALGYPLLLISRNSLGTINHTALAIAEIRRRALPLVGTVLVNTLPTSSLDQASNFSLIEGVTGLRPLGIFPFLKSMSPHHLADAFRDNVDTRPILTALFT